MRLLTVRDLDNVEVTDDFHQEWDKPRAFTDEHGGVFQIEPKRLKWLRQFWQPVNGQRAANKPLVERLLSVGGLWVTMPALEEDLDKILQRGRTWTGTARLIRGLAGKCHANSAWLYEHHKRWKLCTGYALSEDGLWRQHSWCLDSLGRTVETTVRRVLYHGFVMTRAEADQFVYDND